MHELLKEAPELETESSGDDQELQRKNQGRRTRIAVMFTLILIALALMAGLLLMANWPFTRDKVIADLEDAVEAKVEIGSFHSTFLHPGCVAENVVFKPRTGNLPPITVKRLIIQATFRGLLSKRVSLLRAEGLNIAAPNPRPLAAWISSKPSQVVVDRYEVASSIVDFGKGAPSVPLKFEISEFRLENPSVNQATTFDLILHNPTPPGELRASGNLGPWKKADPGQTAISGSYSLQHADLAAFHGIAGTTSSDGGFQGTLRQLEVQGKTTMPDFELTDTAHKMGLTTQFRSQVTTEGGNVTLEQLVARLGKSYLSANGNVAGTPGEKGKTASLNLVIAKGKIQDFLFLFLKDPDAPMNGEFSFQGNAVLPPEKAPFLAKVELQGDFGIEGARLSNPVTQANLEQLSERAEGEKDAPPERVVSDLKGHVVLRRGTAFFSNLSFKVPGALVKLQGTYNLITHRINLHGKLLMEAKLHQATSGVKSFFLKIIDPFLKKNHRGGAVFPVSVTGIYPHPIYKTDPI